MTETEKEQAKDKLQDSVQEDGAEEEMEVSAVNTAEDNNSNIGIGKHDHPDQTEKPEDDLQEDQPCLGGQLGGQDKSRIMVVSAG